MKKTLFNKVKYIAESFAFYGKRFLKDVRNFMSPSLYDADGVKELLRSTASVNDMFSIDTALRGVYSFDGKLHNVMNSSEYRRYDDAVNFNEIIYFNGEKATTLNDNELEKAFKVLNTVSDMTGKKMTAYCIVNNGKHQYYVYIHEGKNGCGDFVDDDMKSVVKYLDAMKEAGATWRTVTDFINDIVDDTSNWVITFTVD